MERTLLLNQSYEPIAAISWQRAIVLAVLEKAEVVEEYNAPVRSPSTVMNRPAVIRLIKDFKRHKHRMKFSKQHVFARDRWKCQYCNRRKAPEDLTYDHVIPRSRGGKTCWENIVTACIDCNARKADRIPEEAGMFPKMPPRRPDWVPSFSMRIARAPMPEEWKPYCYWVK
jgi:5-methylcytosine-specific restriction endonuclease McrA